MTDELTEKIERLTPRQARFLKLYIESNFKNANRCALEAGYSDSSSKRIGEMVLRSPRVNELVQMEMDRQGMTVKDLVSKFRTRIEMRQIGVRHEAKMVGGLGCCGRELCCAAFLNEFAPVSVKMAKEQNLALNPAKISGVCGRLMCCLTYEYNVYLELKKGLPKMGKRIITEKGEGKVIRQSIMDRVSTILLSDGEELDIHHDQPAGDQYVYGENQNDAEEEDFDDEEFEEPEEI